jgi:hypothetical protein
MIIRGLEQIMYKTEESCVWRRKRRSHSTFLSTPKRRAITTTITDRRNVSVERDKMLPLEHNHPIFYV